MSNAARYKTAKMAPMEMPTIAPVERLFFSGSVSVAKAVEPTDIGEEIGRDVDGGGTKDGRGGGLEGDD